MGRCRFVRRRMAGAGNGRKGRGSDGASFVLPDLMDPVPAGNLGRLEAMHLAGRNALVDLHRGEVRAGPKVGEHGLTVAPDTAGVVDAVDGARFGLQAAVCGACLDHRGDGMPPEHRLLPEVPDAKAGDRDIDGLGHRHVQC